MSFGYEDNEYNVVAKALAKRYKLMALDIAEAWLAAGKNYSKSRGKAYFVKQGKQGYYMMNLNLLISFTTGVAKTKTSIVVPDAQTWNDLCDLIGTMLDMDVGYPDRDGLASLIIGNE